MITDIPTKEDFYNSALAMLNLSWDSISGIYTVISDSDFEEWDENGDVTEEYWKASQQPISVALALAQQGTELLIKGSIVEVSPYILLSGSPKDWPSGCNKSNMPFSEFKTIDAHELIRAYDTICENKLPSSFKQEFEKLRKMRNSILHSVNHTSRPTGLEVYKVILNAMVTLVQDKSWVSVRRDYLENNPSSIAYDVDITTLQLSNEIENLIGLLKPKEASEYLSFNKKTRNYACYDCWLNCREFDGTANLAKLKPNTSTSTSLYCILCDQERNVIRKKCDKTDCKGNVLDAEDEVCLTCME